MTTAPPQAHHRSRPIFVRGSRWRIVRSTKHAALEVEIEHVNRHGVTFRPVRGRKSGGRAWSKGQREKRWTWPVAQFLWAYRPV